ncbi:hypothetical protein [Puniceibacterium confluentis]|uniref:hypothetical protein n=1 Tax=Puniceibacterium confluentis TaxID=1958944 RepID=UPI0011B8572D|nr:hypothetical protein [Puniceibacterium confluentis]
MTDRTETNRGRVRRLLIDPMNELGYQRPAGVKADPWSAELDKLCDDLAYMGDHDLVVLFQMIRTKGQGRLRKEWLRRGAMLTFAQIVQPQPVEELRNLVSWFRSIEGPRAERQGVLVQEFEFFARHHRPPLNDGERRVIATRAASDARLRQLREEGRVLDHDDSARLAQVAAMAERVAMIMTDQQGDAA